MGILSQFRDAWVNRKTLGETHKTRELAAFLPAALEIQESPQNPIAKWLGRCLVVLFVLLIIWACVGQVNIVASAEGKIIPSSRVKSIQPLEKAVVKNILVSEGEYVEKGQALIELDSTLTRADEKNIGSQLYSAELTLAVNRGLLSLLESVADNNAEYSFKEITLQTVIDVNSSDALLHRRLLWQQWQQYSTQKKSLESSLEKLKQSKPRLMK